MQKEKMEELTNSIIEKVGEEKAGLIADDIGLIITNNATMNNEISQKDSEIDKLKVDKENLITTNGNLLQQIAMGEDEGNLFTRKKEETENKPKEINYRDLFDEKRKF